MSTTASAAELPPELFPFILDYVGSADDGAEIKDQSRVRDLQSCSLVCLDWANRCRAYLFS